MSTIEEGRERLRAGMWVLIREASGARNLHALLPLVHEFGPHRSRSAPTTGSQSTSPRRGTSTRWCVRRSPQACLPEDALDMASFNPAQWHGLRELGALAPGYQADVLVLPDLERFVPELVLKAGRPVGEFRGSRFPSGCGTPSASGRSRRTTSWCRGRETAARA